VCSAVRLRVPIIIGIIGYYVWLLVCRVLCVVLCVVLRSCGAVCEVTVCGANVWCAVCGAMCDYNV
jgi:hypothetical protein